MQVHLQGFNLLKKGRIMINNINYKNITIFSKITRITFALFVLLTLVFNSSCSYVSDMVEGAITNRAGFSIKTIKTNDDIKISWNYDASDSAFTGYEIYVSKEPNDEFSGYILLASKYASIDKISSLEAEHSSLKQSSTQEFIFDITDSHYSDITINGKGDYYFRVGVLHWDKKNKADRNEANGYDLSTGSYDTKKNYNDHSIIDTISGFSIIDIE